MPTETYTEEKQVVGDDGELITIRRKITKTTKTVRTKGSRQEVEDDEEDSQKGKKEGGGCSWLRKVCCCCCCSGGQKSKGDTAEPIPDKDVKAYEKDCLKWHNHYRAMHGTPPLKINSKLTSVAQDWANTLAKKGYMEHRDNCDYGENIYYISSTDPDFNISGKEPCDKWYSEIKLYSFGREPSNMDAGHFTQLIWKNTKEVGIGRARANNKIFVVANYAPAGNMMGQFKANVPPPK